MIVPFWWKEVLLTPSALRYGLVKQALEREKIPFREKMVSSGSAARARGGWWGQLGERPELETLYYLYVRREDLERAAHLAAQIRE